jgi:hypothetical protein
MRKGTNPTPVQGTGGRTSVQNNRNLNPATSQAKPPPPPNPPAPPKKGA